MRRRLVAALLGLAGCTTPSEEAYVPGGSRAGALSVVAIGTNARGEPCRLLRSGTGAEVLCGDWEAPSARIREVPMAPVAQLAAEAGDALAGRFACEPPTSTSMLGGQPAALLNCRRLSGGWPSFAVVTTAAGRAWQGEGMLPALPATERAIGVLSGLVQADGPLPPSAALDLLASRLSRETFGANDVGRYEQLMAIGRDANQAERFAAAETAYRAALALQERLLGAGSPETFAPLARLALQISNQGRFAEAEALLARAAALAPRASDPLAPALLAHYRGLHETNRGRPDAALVAFARADGLYAAALTQDQRTGGRVVRVAGLETGGTVVDPVASRALVGAVEVSRNRAAVLRSAGRMEEAEAAVQRTERLATSLPGIAGADLVSARIARTSGAAAATAEAARGRFDTAAARFARGAPRSRPFADTLLLRVAAQRRTGDPPGAVLDACRQAVAVLRELREGTSPSAIAPCVAAFAEASSGSQGPLAEAFEAAQLAQGSVTTAQISQAAARLAESTRNPAASEAIRRREEANRTLAGLFRQRDEATSRGRVELAALDSRIAEAQAAALDADQAVQAAAPGFAQLVQSVVPASEILPLLRPSEALVSIFLAPAGPNWTFVLLDGAIAAGRIGATLTEIDLLVARARSGVESGDASKPFDADAAHRLHRALFAEVAEPVMRSGRLVFVPAGQLLSLPFGLLVEAPPPSSLGHSGVQFLLDRAIVSHVPAPSSFAALRRTGTSGAPRPWSGFGNPQPIPLAQASRTFASPECGRLLASLPALPFSARELDATRQLIGASARDEVSGRAFTVDAVRQAQLRDYRILHFATHGLLPGELSCLSESAILTSAPPAAPTAAGALLTASAVLSLELDADAVLLSACNPGGGAAAGESLSGLARAFFYAGARSLFVTHWYINDIAAARVVAVMIRDVREGKDLAEALQAAQIDLRRIPGGEHPALWGAFALVGPGPLVERRIALTGNRGE